MSGTEFRYPVLGEWLAVAWSEDAVTGQRIPEMFGYFESKQLAVEFLDRCLGWDDIVLAEIISGAERRK
jgi:hypothetical protein